MSRRNKVLVLGAAYGTGNMGVDALLSGSIASVLHSDPQAEIVLLDFSYEPRTHWVPGLRGVVEVRLENLRFSWKLWLRNNGFRLLALALLMRVLPVSLRRPILRAHPALEVIRNSSITLSLAGGDSFSDIYGFRRLLYVSLPQLLVIAMNRAPVLLPQTLGPFKSTWARWIGRFIMRRAEHVFARDLQSLEVARTMLGGATGHCDFSPDMAFALESAIPQGGIPPWAGRSNRPLVGLNVSGLLFVGGYTHSNMFGLNCSYPDLIKDIIWWFTGTADADVVLITHVTGAESDFDACSKIHEEMEAKCGEKLHLAEASHDHREIKYLIGCCDFFLGARMHACIAALSQGVPAIGMAYSRKFEGVFDSVDAGELIVDLRTLTATESMKRISSAFAMREVYQKRLIATSSGVRSAARELFGKIAGGHHISEDTSRVSEMDVHQKTGVI